MRIDMEQFLAVAMALGTAGAIGVAVVSQHGDDEPVAADSDAQEQADEPEVVASPSPEPAPKPVVATEPAAPPPLPEEPDEDFLKDPALDGMPAPHVEGFG